MPSSRILKFHHKIVHYDPSHLALLKTKRKRSLELLRLIKLEGLNPYVFGSIARGDVNLESDIDIIFTERIPLYKVEYILEKYGFERAFKEIIMATPKDVIKLYVYLNEYETITIPLSKITTQFLDFYDFGGKVDFAQIKQDERVPGVNKNLVFIKPIENGHEERSIIGIEHLVAKELKINLNLVNERVRVLTRREKKGHTGVFLKKEVSFDETIESVLFMLAKNKSLIRKKLSGL